MHKYRPQLPRLIAGVNGPASRPADHLRHPLSQGALKPMFSHRRRLTTVLPALSATLLFLVTGCGSKDSPPPQPPVAANDTAGDNLPALPPPIPAAPGASPNALGGTGALAVRQDPALGAVVTGDGGFTLYRFEKDDPKTPKSTCDGQCAQTWPPVPAGAAPPTGIDAKVLGEVTRTDGARQLTIGGWPVYRYSQDKAPGETKGQTVPNWGAIAPDGKRAGLAGGGSEGGDVGSGGKEGAGGQESGDRTGGHNNNGNQHGGVREDTEVQVIIQPILGQILVDSRGRTLYSNGGGLEQTRCRGECLRGWRPAAVSGLAPSFAGIDKRLISTRRLPDESLQLVINGQPLFLFEGDAQSGRIEGQGRDGCWWAQRPDGRDARK